MTWLPAKPLQEVFLNEGCDEEAQGWDARTGQRDASVITWQQGDLWGTACDGAGEWMDARTVRMDPTVRVPLETGHTQTGERFKKGLFLGLPWWSYG